jgi:hypothetical protein
MPSVTRSMAPQSALLPSRLVSKSLSKGMSKRPLGESGFGLQYGQP